MIRSLQLTNFTNFQDATLTLGGLTLLVGTRPRVMALEMAAGGRRTGLGATWRFAQVSRPWQVFGVAWPADRLSA
jgi:hypothetical protein